MSNHHSDTHVEHAHDEHGGMTKKKIWSVFFLLLFITVIEFIIALWAIPGGHMSQGVGNYVYIALTLLKAYYIVAYFMHLKFEKLGLQITLTISFIFIIYFIVLMLIEGNYIHDHVFQH